MGLRRCNEHIATAAQLSSEALSCAAPADGRGKGDPFRGAAVSNARPAVDSLHRSWPSVQGFADCPDDPGERASCTGSQAENTQRMASPQHAGPLWVWPSQTWHA